MNYFDTLFVEKKYIQLLTETNNIVEPDILYLRISSLIMLQKIDEAEIEIIKNIEILKKDNLAKIIKYHINFLLDFRSREQAFEQLKIYQDLPYHSQVVEELLNTLNKELITFNASSSKEILYEDDIIDILEHSNSNNDILEALLCIQKYNITDFISILVNFIKKNGIKKEYQTYALLLLVEAKCDVIVEFSKNNNFYKVNTSQIKPPFTDNFFNDCMKIINQKSLKNTTLNEIALKLFQKFILDIFPAQINDYDKDNLIEVFILLGKEYIGIKTETITRQIDELKISITKILDNSEN